MKRREFLSLMGTTALASGLLLTGCGKGAESDDRRVIRIGHVQSASHPDHLGLTAFAEHINNKLGDKYRVEVYPSELLGSQTEMVQLTQTGAIDFVVASNAIMETFSSQYQIFNLPYLFSSVDAYHAAMDDPEVTTPIFKTTSKAGLETVTWLDAGTRNFYTVKTPINQPSDLKGLKIRVQQSPTNVEMMRLLGGIFSATEGSAIAVVYSLGLAFCYRSINLKSLWRIVVDSAKMSGMVVFLVGVSNILGWVMAFLQIPDAVAAALLSLTSNEYIILLIMNVILLVAGTFMDVTPAILIFTPLFLPICQSFGMHPIHFGLILVYNLCIGNITPPVGNALFVGIKVGRTTLAKVMPYMLMYYAAIILGLLLVTYIPAVSMVLPQVTGLV